MTATYETRIAARRTHLTKLRAERLDPLDLPRTMTQREVNAYVDETATLDKNIAAFEAKAEALGAFPTLDADTTWLGHLNSWRQTLCDELLALPPRIRDRAEITRQQNLAFAIKLIDFGFGAAKLPIVDLSSTRLGELMREAGYETQGEALRGPRGWRGSIKEVETRIKALVKQRAAAEAALDPMLLDDAERAKADAESQAHRDALNTMEIKGNAAGTGLVAFTKDGDPLAVADMTPAQKAAFTRFEAVAYPRKVITETEAAGEPVTS